ncbi:MAG: ABC transporter ATP-binding protein [Actinobacteria bacterium]|nr:ABC transporter ATP-binding protein [Actinomycetota bacterium]
MEIVGLVKSFGATPVLRNVDLTVPEATLTAVLGASGSGKTTLLGIIAGFERADAGTVRIGGRVVVDGSRAERPQTRKVGYVPQDAMLFPHMTVAQNVGFGVPRGDRAAVAGLIERVGLAGFERRYPHQLSGGQAQRVALARALAIEPEVVLLDEPFGALDAALRESVRADVIDIIRASRLTAVLVTHDQDEALSVADSIALLDEGVVAAHDTPASLYLHPPTPEVAQAIGSANILDGSSSGDRVTCVLGELAIDRSSSLLDAADVRADSRSCRVLVRPEQLVLSRNATDEGLAGTVIRVRYHGHDALVDCEMASTGHLFTARTPAYGGFTPGESIRLSFGGGPVYIWV